MKSDVSRLARQVDFLIECDRLKDVFRQNVNSVSRRQENDAEHSWALCLFAVTLAEHSNVEIDLLRVLKMLLLHDIVEIDAGDTFAYDDEGLAGQYEREARAADRIFGLLPEDQGAEYRGLWEEFEAKRTAESRFATAVDRFQPMLLNSITEGMAWRKHGVTHRQVVQRNACVADGSEALWTHILERLELAVTGGHLDP